MSNAWRALGGDPSLLEKLRTRRATGLVSPLPVGDLVAGATDVQILAAEKAAVDAAGQIRLIDVDAANAWRSRAH